MPQFDDSKVEEYTEHDILFDCQSEQLHLLDGLLSSDTVSDSGLGQKLSLQDCLKRENAFFVGKRGWEDAPTSLWTRGEWIGRSCGKGSHILGSYTKSGVCATLQCFAHKTKVTFRIM